MKTARVEDLAPYECAADGANEDEATVSAIWAISAISEGTRLGQPRERAQRAHDDDPEDPEDPEDNEDALGLDLDEDDFDEEPSAEEEGDDDLDAFDPGDDSDLGLDIGGDESVGLDTSEGFDDTSDETGLPELDRDEAGDAEGSEDSEEEGTWAADADELADLPDLDTADDDEPEQAEYGWLDDEETGIADDLGNDEIDDEPTSDGHDDGAEGLEDDSDIEDVDLVELPALDLGAEEEFGLPGLENMDEWVGSELMDEPVVEIAPGQFCKMLRPGATRATRIAWPQAPARQRASEGGTGDGSLSALDPRALAVNGQTLWLASSGLYRLGPQTDAFSEVPLDLQVQLGAHASDSPVAQAVAVTEHEGVLQLALIVNDCLCLSEDAGESFAVQRSPEVTHIGFTHSVTGPNIWWRTVAGELGSDCAASPAKGQVLALHADGHRAIAYLERQAEQTVTVVSQDGGRSFGSCAVEVPPSPRPPRIEICGHAWLLCAGETPLCGAVEGPVSPVAPQAVEPATLGDEEGDTFAYACVAREDAWLVIRRSPRSPQTPPIVLASLPRALVDRPLAMVVSDDEGGMLTVFIAAASALVRVEVSLDGEIA